jgi:hypothetical protein
MSLNSLPADLAKFVHDALASGKYLSTEALVCDALQTLRAQEDRGTAPPEHAPPPANPLQSPEEYLQALAIQQQRQAAGYRVIPLLLSGIEPTALESWFEEEPLAVPISLTVTGLSEALPAILVGLGEPGSVAIIWYPIGMVHRAARQFDQAEHAYR